MDDGKDFTARLVIWERIAAYVEACGGDTSDKTVSDRRMDAVSAVEEALEQLVVGAMAEMKAKALEHAKAMLRLADERERAANWAEAKFIAAEAAIAELKAEHRKEINELLREHQRDLRDCAAEARADAAEEYRRGDW